MVNFHFSHYKSMETISCHSNQSSYRTGTKNTIICWVPPTYRCCMWNMKRICFRGDAVWKCWQTTDGWRIPSYTISGGHTGLVVRASDSGSGDLGLILGRVGVLFPWARDIYSPKVLVIPRNRWLRLNMTEKLFTGMFNHNQNKTNHLHTYGPSAQAS